MTANMLSYMGGFLMYGFVELQRKIFVEGFLYGLNHAFYTALFGAGLAYATDGRGAARNDGRFPWRRYFWRLQRTEYMA